MIETEAMGCGIGVGYVWLDVLVLALTSLAVISAWVAMRNPNARGTEASTVGRRLTMWGMATISARIAWALYEYGDFFASPVGLASIGMFALGTILVNLDALNAHDPRREWRSSMEN